MLRELIKAIRKCADEKELHSLFEALLTPSELREIPTRLEIVKLLRTGKPQREISEELGVGIATVTRGAKISSAEVFARIFNNP